MVFHLSEGISLVFFLFSAFECGILNIERIIVKSYTVSIRFMLDYKYSEII